MGGLQLLLLDRLLTNVSQENLVFGALSSSSTRNIVYIGIFAFVELAFTLIAASYFATADGNASAAIALKKSGGAFAFLAGLLGWYTVGHLMCQEALIFRFPMGDTSHYFKPRKLNEERPAPQHH